MKKIKHTNQILINNEIEKEEKFTYLSDNQINDINSDEFENGENSLRNRSSTNMNCFFKADAEEEKIEKDFKILSVNNIRDHTIQFSYLRFLEFFIYHLFFMVILGPFSILIFFKKPGMFLIRNMQFNLLSFNSFLQFIPFFSLIFILYNYLENERTSILKIEFCSFLSGLFFKIFIDSIKYGSFPDDKIGFYKNQIVDQNNFLNDLTIPSILKPNDQLIYSEIMNALTRADIDRTLFWVFFFVSPHKKILKRLRCYKDELIEYHHKKWLDYIVIFPSNDKSDKEERKISFPVDKDLAIKVNFKGKKFHEKENQSKIKKPSNIANDKLFKDLNNFSEKDDSTNLNDEILEEKKKNIIF